jgi:murein DD-endopeptidase MepM/ murein hydrolase activator NlpD
MLLEADEKVVIDGALFFICLTGISLFLIAAMSFYLCSRTPIVHPIKFVKIKEPTKQIRGEQKFLLYPVKFEYISGFFSIKRFHPILKRFLPHLGIDFAAKPGTPVISVADGKIVFAGKIPGDGNVVKIKHDNRYTTAYAHLSKITVRSGTIIKRGQIIGTVGSTGLSTGPHLHYSFYDGGKSVDPIKAVKKMA